MEGCCVSVIQLSEEEERLFKFLLESLSFSSQNHVVLRVAGGWVRDKVIKKSSNDIDIVVEGVKNVESFMNSINDYICSLGQSRKTFGIIEANPEHGKHGSSCNMMLFDISVDFVVVRGSGPLEDAQFRDLTINAMFYNINSGKVEDLTGKGLYDLEHKILRTPVHPSITLEYDPLRAVRTARFASVLCYTLEETLKETLMSSKVRIDIGEKSPCSLVCVLFFYCPFFLT